MKSSQPPLRVLHQKTLLDTGKTKPAIYRPNQQNESAPALVTNGKFSNDHGLGKNTASYEARPKWSFIIMLTPMLVISALCVAVVVKILILGNNESQAKTSQICVSCDLLPAGPESDELTSSLSKRMKDGREKCCAGNVDQVSTILKLIQQKQHLNTGSPMSELIETDPSHVSAHKQLVIVKKLLGLPELSNRTNAHLGLDSEDHDPQRQHANNVEVLPSGYVILVSGSYHIYSSIEFRAFNSRPCREYGLKTWRQVVVRSRVNQRHASGVLLSSAHTCCDDCVWDMETSYTGGTFLLQAGDHLHVEVSSLGLVNLEPESSYFGLVMVAGSGLQ